MTPARARRRWRREEDVALLTGGCGPSFGAKAAALGRTRYSAVRRVRLLREQAPDLFQACWVGPLPKAAPEAPLLGPTALARPLCSALGEIARRQAPDPAQARPYRQRTALMLRLEALGLVEQVPGVGSRTNPAFRVTVAGLQLAPAVCRDGVA